MPESCIIAKSEVEAVIETVRQLAHQIAILFVTSIRTDTPIDIGNDGLSQLAQYYTEQQANDILAGFRSLGVTVQAFMSERDFIGYLAGPFDRDALPAYTLVYTTAEGGHGSARRSLIPALCRLYGLPCCNSGAYGSATGRHKFHANLLAGANGVSVPESWFYTPLLGWFGNRRPPLGLKVILKPTYESASIGISRQSVVRVAVDFDARCEDTATLWKQSVTVQEFCSGYEIGVPVAQVPRAKAFPPVVFAPPSGTRYGQDFRTFEDENLVGRRRYAAADFLQEDQISSICSDAIRAFQAIELEGVGRIDMRIDEDGRWHAFDLNESPPPVYNSAFGYALQTLGFEYREFLAFLIGVNLRLKYPAATANIA